MTQHKTVYRPPMEHDSLIINLTEGCSHNKCTFCTMYKDIKFRIRDIEHIKNEIQGFSKLNNHINKVFLGEGDALILKTNDLVEILDTINHLFPNCDHIASYARVSDVMLKSSSELKLLKEKGLKKLYLGVESGSEQVLSLVNKKSSKKDIIEACKRLKEASIIIYTTVLLGIGGRELTNEHIEETSKLMNEIQPNYLSVMTLLIKENSIFYENIKRNKIQPLSPKMLIKEAIDLVSNLNLTDTNLRINHASNFLSIDTMLPEGKEEALINLNAVLSYDIDLIDKYRRL